MNDEKVINFSLKSRSSTNSKYRTWKIRHKFSLKPSHGRNLQNRWRLIIKLFSYQSEKEKSETLR